MSLYRAFEFHRALLDGQLVPRWAPDFFFGLGYPFFNFYAPLPFYLTSLLHLAGASLPAAVEALLAAGFLASAGGMYRLARLWLPPAGGALAAVAYVYFPYHLVDAHLRGDLAEFLALAWAPWVLWAAARAVRRPGPGNIALAALLYAALILTHNVMALVFSGLLVLWGLWQAILSATPLSSRSSFHSFPLPPSPFTLARGLAALAAVLALGVGLAAYFWLPALTMLSTVQSERLLNHPLADFHFNFPADLLGTGVVVGYLRQEAGPFGYLLQIGLWQAALAGAGLVVAGAKRHWRCLLGGGGFFVLAAAGLLVLMWPGSVWIWERVPLLPFVQMPWRLLGPLGLGTAAMAGHLAATGRPRTAALAALGLSLLLVVTHMPGLEPRRVELQPSDLTIAGVQAMELATQAIGTTTLAEYVPTGLARPVAALPALANLLGPAEPGRASIAAAPPGTRVLEEVAHTGLLVLSGESPAAGNLTLALALWDGWRADVDGLSVVLRPGPVGPTLPVPAGPWRVELRWRPTLLHAVGAAISIASSLLLLALLMLALRQRLVTRARDRAAPVEGLVQEAAGWRPEALLAVGAALSVLLFIGAAGLAAEAGRVVAPSLRPLDVTYGDALQLAGYRLVVPAPGQGVARPGDRLRLLLRWRPLRPVEGEVSVFIHLVNVARQTVAQFDRPLEARGRPVAGWEPGQSVDVGHDLLMPSVPPGVYLLRLGLYDPDSQVRLPLTEERLVPLLLPTHVLELGPFVLGEALRERAPLHPLEADLPPLRLEGFDVGAELDGEEEAGWTEGTLTATAGQIVPLRLFWRALRRPGDDYKFFAHLRDAGDRIVAQVDREPSGGGFPTTAWRPGQAVVDPFDFPLPAGLAPDLYRLVVGIYRPGRDPPSPAVEGAPADPAAAELLTVRIVRD